MYRMLKMAVALALPFMFACGGADAPRLRAGAAVVDITPEVWPLPLVGGFRYHPASGAHDPLHSRAVVLEDGKTEIAIAVVDSCYVSRAVLDEAKRRASEATGIPSERMLIAATHTHSAPPAAPGLGIRGPGAEDLGDNEALYSERLTQGVADSIIRAHEGLEDAEIGWGSEPLPDEVFNRRWFMKDGSIPPDPFGGTTDTVRMNPPRASADLIRPAGPTDPEVYVLSVRTAKGAPLALLANYSLHYVGGTPRGEVSADYFGEFALQIGGRLGAAEGFVGILSNGTSGNINNIDFSRPREPREPFEQIQRVAGKVADTAYRAYSEIEHRPWVPLAMAERTLTLQMRKPTAEGYEQAKQAITALDIAEHTRPVVYARRAIRLYEGPATTEIKLQALRIGGLGITAIPFETFVETGLELKRKSPLKSTFTIELANGAMGYLPTPAHHELGGYETWLGTNRVEKSASVKVTAMLLELLGEISGDSPGLD